MNVQDDFLHPTQTTPNVTMQGLKAQPTKNSNPISTSPRASAVHKAQPSREKMNVQDDFFHPTQTTPNVTMQEPTNKKLKPIFTSPRASAVRKAQPSREEMNVQDDFLHPTQTTPNVTMQGPKAQPTKNSNPIATSPRASAVR